MASKLEQSLQGWIHAEQPSTTRRPLLVFIGLSLVIAASCLALGPYRVSKFSEDTLYFLTQGDLLRDGYRPGVDYHTMHGPFPFLFTAAAMKFYGVSLTSIIVAQVAGALFFGCLMYRIASGRLSGTWAVFLAIAVELILVTCTPIGSKSWREFTCAMWYNLVAYCIHSILFLYLLVPRRSGEKSAIRIDDAVAAFLLAAIYLTKFSYFLPVLTTFVTGTILLPRTGESRWRGVGMLALASGFALAILAAIQGSPGVATSLVKTLTLRVSPLMTSLRFLHYTRTISLFLFGLALIGWNAWESRLLKGLIREAILALMMLGTLLAAAGTSAQDPEMLPMIGVVLVGLVVRLVTVSQQLSQRVNPLLVNAALTVALLLLVHEPKNSILSWFFSHIDSFATISDPVQYSPASAFDRREALLAPDVDPMLFFMLPQGYSDYLIEGLSMLKKAGATDADTIFVAADVSPIIMLAGARYAHGIAAWWPSIFVRDPLKARISDPNLLSDADFVLRRTNDKMFWQHLMHHRGDYFSENFELVASSPDWELYTRRPKPADETSGELLNPSQPREAS